MSEFDDPFSLHAQSRPSGRRDEEGREIRLVGPTVLAMEINGDHSAVPDEYVAHPLISGRHFYALPLGLLEAIVTTIGEERFQQDTLRMERELGAICDESQIVGFAQGRGLRYEELQLAEFESFSEELVHDSGLTPASVDHAIEFHVDRDLPSFTRFAQGYCGWLITQQQFLDEHDDLMATHVDTINRWGINHYAANLPASYTANMIPETDPHQDPSWRQFATELNSFLVRWRLDHLAGPYLPVPLKPLMAGAIPATVLERLMSTGGVFYLPETMPVPSRDHLRSLLDQALHRGERPSHLEEWMDIVRSDNMARNRMAPFVRYLALQHYWRILHQRHANAISRNLGKCQSAFGEHFRVSAKQINVSGGLWLVQFLGVAGGNCQGLIAVGAVESD